LGGFKHRESSEMRLPFAGSAALFAHFTLISLALFADEFSPAENKMFFDQILDSKRLVRF
jgi:hypothetical protein